MPSLMAVLGLDIIPFVNGMNQAKGKAATDGQGIGSALGNNVSNKLKGLLGAAAIEETIRRTVEYGSKVNDLALRLGISTTAVQEWDYALKQNGSSIDAAASFFEKLAVARGKVMKGGAGGDSLAEDFAKLGIGMDQLKNSRIEDIAATIAKAFEAGDPQALIGSLRAVGGKSAGELVTAFREGLAGQLDDALVISPEDIANLDRAGDAFDRIATTLRGLSAGPIAGAVGLMDVVAQGWKNIFAGSKTFWETGDVNAALRAAYNSQAEYENRIEADDKRRKELSKPKSAIEEEPDAKTAAKEQAIAERELAKAEKEAAQAEAKAQKDWDAAQERAAKDAKDSMPFKPGSLEVNSLQKSGFFVGGLGQAPEIAMLDVTKKSEAHLADIKKGIARLINVTDASEADDTQF